MNIDSVVKYLILIFVSVFDPLAICLVIASTHALESRKNHKLQKAREQATENVTAIHKPESVLKPRPVPEPILSPQEALVAEAEPEPEDVIVQMSFKDENEDKKAV